MKYAVVTVTDGNFIIRSEWGNPEGAIKAFHGLASALWNDTGFTEGYVAIQDSNLDIYQGYKEHITHPAPEPVPVDVVEEEVEEPVDDTEE